MARLYESYDENHPPIQCFMTQSTWYRNSGSFTPKGILLHDTGCNNPWLSRYVQPDDDAPNRDELIKLIGKNRYGNDWNHTEKQAGLNCWIGKLEDGKVTTLQTGPWTKRPWGCGSGSNGYSLNDTHIQWEICEDAKTDKAYFADCYQETIHLCAYLCQKFNIDPHGTITYRGIKVPTIVCHWDSYCLKPKCGSGHDDIYDWTVMYEYLGIKEKDVNKNDPYNNLIMKRIRDDIAALLSGPHNEWVKENGKWYYYDGSGTMVKSEWVLWKTRWYYLGPDGAMLTGWQEIEGKTYYLYTSDGHMASYEWIDNKWLNKNGSQTYPYIGSWKSNKKGKWYEDTSGYYPKDCEQKINKKKYKFDKRGYVIE